MSSIAIPIWALFLVLFLWPSSVAAAIWFAMARGFAYRIEKDEVDGPVATTNSSSMDKEEENREFRAVKA